MRSSRSLMSCTSCVVARGAPLVRLIISSVARAMNVLVILAVTTARKASPSSITLRPRAARVLPRSHTAYSAVNLVAQPTSGPDD